MKGHLEVIYGCMWAGKSEELIRRIRRLEIAKKKVVVFKPVIDDRYDKNDIVSHSGLKAKAFPIHSVNSIWPIIEDWGPFDVVAIDETQFLATDLFDVIDVLINIGIIVICAGLNQDFRGWGFNIMPEIIARADYAVHLPAVCTKCGGRATKTQRLFKGEPAAKGDLTVKVGGDRIYEARCRQCHQV